MHLQANHVRLNVNAHIHTYMHTYIRNVKNSLNRTRATEHVHTHTHMHMQIPFTHTQTHITYECLRSINEAIEACKYHYISSFTHTYVHTCNTCIHTYIQRQADRRTNVFILAVAVQRVDLSGIIVTKRQLVDAVRQIELKQSRVSGTVYEFVCSHLLCRHVSWRLFGINATVQ